MREVEARSIQADQVTTGGDVLEPDEVFTRTVLAFVPADRYRLVRLAADVFVVRADKLEPEARSSPAYPQPLPVDFTEPPYEQERGVTSASTTRSIIESSWIKNLLRDDRYVQTDWIVSRPGDPASLYPALAVDVRRGNAPTDPQAFRRDVTALTDQYGVVNAYTSAELALTSLEAATGADQSSEATGRQP